VDHGTRMLKVICQNSSLGVELASGIQPVRISRHWRCRERKAGIQYIGFRRVLADDELPVVTVLVEELLSISGKQPARLGSGPEVVDKVADELRSLGPGLGGDQIEPGEIQLTRGDVLVKYRGAFVVWPSQPIADVRDEVVREVPEIDVEVGGSKQDDEVALNGIGVLAAAGDIETTVALICGAW